MLVKEIKKFSDAGMVTYLQTVGRGNWGKACKTVVLHSAYVSMVAELHV